LCIAVSNLPLSRQWHDDDFCSWTLWLCLS
jgi:hypothetical protein